jgi:hypothetical protein
MRAAPKDRRQEAKRAVVNTLERLMEDGHPRNQTLIARYARCRRLQTTAALFAAAVDASARAYNRTPLAAPPGCLQSVDGTGSRTAAATRWHSTDPSNGRR